MSAGDVQSKLSAFCAEQGVYYNKIITSSKRGIPDVMIVVNGVTYWFEVKYGKDRLSAKQEEVIDKLNEHKEIAFVVKDFVDFITIYKELAEIKPVKPKEIKWSL